MILKAAGHGDVVNPLDYGGGRRPIPNWMWGAIGVSVALHIGGAIFLYSQQFVTIAPSPEDDRTIELIPYVKPVPPPVRPTETPRTAHQNPPIHTPEAAPPDGVEHAPFAPNPDGQTGEGPITNIQAGPPETGPAVSTTSAPPGVIRSPNWVSRPSAAQMERAYPVRALEEGLGGRVTIQCAVTVSGALTGCSVVSETPLGKGFGQAALRLSKYFRMSPKTVDGAPVEGALVTVPIGFSAQ